MQRWESMEELIFLSLKLFHFILHMITSVTFQVIMNAFEKSLYESAPLSSFA